MSPSYHQLAYEYDDDDGKMEYRGEIFLMAGTFAFALAVILGVTSLPSVTAAMTWKEFAFVQSYLGWACLLFASVHNISYGWPFFFHPSCHIPPSFQVRVKRKSFFD